VGGAKCQACTLDKISNPGAQEQELRLRAQAPEPRKPRAYPTMYMKINDLLEIRGIFMKFYPSEYKAFTGRDEFEGGKKGN
jgi:hypothetical protein